MTLDLRASLMVTLITVAACGSPGPDPATPDAGSERDAGSGLDAIRDGAGGGAIAEFDCSAIQGPLSTNRFYEDNPTYTDPVDDSASWTMSDPEAQGIDSTGLERASTELSNLPYTSSFLVIRHGALVFERYYHGSAKNQSNNVHSASKSIWGAAIGIAINQGVIPGVDTTIASALPSRYAEAMSPQARTMKVRDLVTMTSGIQWSEDTTENRIQRSSDWIAEILELPMTATPGTRFNYSTGNTHLSSAVLASAIQTTTCEFIHQHLLAPLGIVAEHWGRDPQGYVSGGYNFYVTPRELAKFGLLYLRDGNWNGRQLVPAAWVATSMTKQVEADDPYGYGYNFWLRDLAGHDVAVAWGFGGQMIYIVKDLDLVVVMTTNTRDFAQDAFDGASIIEDDVIPAVDMRS
ncbi:MAG: serine hydrolase [Myxococcales bacterium]|nr:serine hydrolase [Myxococcales bacterium]